MLEEISENLVDICDSIIKQSENEGKPGKSDQFCHNGKKYRQLSDGNFCRVQGEDKYLVVGRDYAEFRDNYSLYSSYYILKKQGTVLDDYRQLCLAIIFTSREIELNKWYEANTKIRFADDIDYDLDQWEDETMDYISKVSDSEREKYIKIGCNLLAATKINFYQTDHHVASPKLEGTALTRLITKVCKDEHAITSKDVYNALRAFCHWCSIRGVLYKLGMKGLDVDDKLKFRFRTFPEIDDWIKDTVYERYPAGTSKYYLIKTSLQALADSPIGELIISPSDIRIENFFEACRQIESDPLRFHVRAASLKLSKNPPMQASALFNNLQKLLEYISVIYHCGSYRISSKFTTSSKLIKYSKLKHLPFFKDAQKLANQIKEIEDTNPEISDASLVSKMGPVNNNIKQTMHKFI